MLAESAIPPELLAQDESFRRTVFDRFQDELLGRLGPWVQPDFARRALGVLAAINPIPAAPGQDLLQRIASLLGGDPVELASLIGELERVGLLVRRGSRLRLTPDVLADHILASACLTPQNRSNGFAQRAFEHFRDLCPDLVLRNIAELDWRVRASGTEEPGLIDEIWASLEAALTDGPSAARVRIIDLVTAAADYQPRRALRLAEIAFCWETESTDPDRTSHQDDGHFDRQDVIGRLPKLLRRCAYNIETLPRCLELLWEISAQTRRAGEDASRQSVEVILDLATYHHDNYVWVNEAVAGAIRQWFQRTPTPNQRTIILEIIERLLAKSGSDTWSEGNRICTCSFYVAPAAVSSIRQMAVSILRNMLDSADLSLQMRAVASLERALNGPMPQGQLPVTAELLAEWEPDQLAILELLSGFIARSQPTVLQLRIFEAVRFQAAYGPRPAVRERARAVVRQLFFDASFEVRLSRLLLTRLARWDQFDDVLDGEDETGDVVARLADRQRRWHAEVVAEIWARYPDAQSAFTFLNETTGRLRSAEPEVNPRSVLWYMLEARPAEAIQFARLAVAAPTSPLAECLQTCLACARQMDPGAATLVARGMLEAPADESGSLFRTAVANHYCWGWPSGSTLNPDDVAIVRRLLADSDSRIRCRALGSLRNVANGALAVELAMSVDIGESADVADELARLTVSSQPGSLTGFSDGDFLSMLSKFERVNRLDHWVCDLLARLVETMPDRVLEFFLCRIAIEEAHQHGMKFHPLPDRGLSALSTVFASINGQNHQAMLARRVRDQAVPKRRYSGGSLARLFRAVSGNYGPCGLEVLREWIDSGDEARIVGAAELLHEAGQNFVFNQRDFVAHTLDRADAMSHECGDRVYRVLLNLTVYSSRIGFVGEVFPQDLELRNRATATLEDLRPGSRLHQLFDAIRRDAESNIQEQQERIEEDGDF